MPGPLFHVGAMAICPHGGQASTISSNSRVMVSGMAIATVADQSLIAGCTFNVVVPIPCLRVQWLVGATRVKVNGLAPLIMSSTGLCLNPAQAPQGPPVITLTQTRVVAI